MTTDLVAIDSFIKTSFVIIRCLQAVVIVDCLPCSFHQTYSEVIKQVLVAASFEARIRCLPFVIKLATASYSSVGLAGIKILQLQVTTAAAEC